MSEFLPTVPGPRECVVRANRYKGTVCDSFFTSIACEAICTPQRTNVIIGAYIHRFRASGSSLAGLLATEPARSVKLARSIFFVKNAVSCEIPRSSVSYYALYVSSTNRLYRL